jgi:hypothetical protein
MIWKDEKYRKVMYVGDVGFGAIYPPQRSFGSWRWRMWINRSGRMQQGRDRDERSARAQVETRFWDFAHTAGLEPKAGAQ